MTRARCALLVWLLALLAAAPALAHTRSESHSSWLIDGRIVRLTFTVADIEAQRITPDGHQPSRAELVRYLAPRLRVDAAKARCPLTPPVRPLAAATGFQRFEFIFTCPQPAGIVLTSTAFFDLVSTHVNLAQVQTPRGDFVEQLVTSDSPSLAMEGVNGEGLENAGFLRFVQMGILHIFTGIDHISFLLGLVLIARNFRDLAFVVTGFTLGHSLTLGLAVTGVLRPHAEYIDALVALTILLIGIENVAAVTGRARTLAAWIGGGLLLMAAARLAGWGLLPPALLLGTGIFAACYLLVSGLLGEAGRLRLVVTTVFGLIHGFGFAADLLETRIPAARLAELLVGFNVGVEIGQLTIITLVTLGVRLLVVSGRALPRRLVTDVAAGFLVCIGTYWFVSRSF